MITSPAYRKAIIAWLLSGCFLVFAMVVVGGITRLTGSGLSITEWNVVMGAIPPMNDDQWQAAFEKYQASPQFLKLNYQYTLSDFKNIFWWEYIHRLIGRIIGIVFIVPFLWFLIKGQIDRRLLRQLVFIFFLGGLQGFIGWYMVKSGLIDNPHVSHYRLATHLITAFTTFGFILWTALDIIFPGSDNEGVAVRRLNNAGKILFSVIIVQIIYGAFVAGLKAGLLYNTFPKMGDEWIAETVGIGYANSGLASLVENPGTVQFIHRCLAFTIIIVYGWLLYAVRKHLRHGYTILQLRVVYLTGGILLLQFLLGVMTLITHVPVVLGVLHQSGAFFLFTVVLVLLHRTKTGGIISVQEKNK